MAWREMFDEYQKIAIQILGINQTTKEKFLSECTHFDPSEKLDYQLPTPLEVYESFGNYRISVSAEKPTNYSDWVENVSSDD